MYSVKATLEGVTPDSRGEVTVPNVPSVIYTVDLPQTTRRAAAAAAVVAAAAALANLLPRRPWMLRAVREGGARPRWVNNQR